MSADFVHLHLHTQYSLLDGANRVKDLIHQVRSLGMDSVAVTDHGNMFGAYELQTAALEAGIKPILGVEAYVAPGSRFDRESVKTFDGEGNNYHLTLLAETAEGYRNLTHLVSEAYLTGFYYKPRMDWELLERFHEGLVALSGCLNSEVSKRLRAGDYDGAKRTALGYRDLFGADRYFIEVMDHGLPEQRQILPDLFRLSKETGIPPVATNDAHYLTRDDAAAHDVLLCIGMGKTLSDVKRMRFYNSEFYVKSAAEMSQAFRAWSVEAVTNTAALAARVEPGVIVDTGLKIPTFPVPEGTGAPEEYLESLAAEGLERRLAPLAADFDAGRTRHRREEYGERLSWELSVIRKMGLQSYFLIVWDFIKFAKDSGIPVGPGRGSAAGSLVAWALGITEVDPLAHDLLFERFLNPDRISMPDIDVDLCERRRGEVIEYVRRKYGRENVGQIITFNSMKARAVIRDVGRVLEVPLAEVNRLCAMIPASPGKPVTLADARRSVRELADALRDNEAYRRLFDLAERLEGVSRHAGVHAAGVLIAPKPLVEYLPLYRNNNDEITTQFEMKSVDRMGLLKMDFLGLITLTILDDALKFVQKRTGTRPDLGKVPLDDPEVYRLFAEGRTDGVFQFESSGMRDLLRRARPERFEDLCALNALYRPGALDAGTVELYIERRRGKPFDYPLPQLEPILRETFGILVYQEQVMLAARAVAGYTPGEADKLRKAIGKKDDALLKAEGAKFLRKAAAAGTPRKKAEELWSLILPFGRYGFNKSHSVVYALLAYQTAWMKAHHPVEFLAATLTANSGKSDDVVKYVNTCREMRIPVLPPDVNSSDLTFTPDGPAIRFGLGAVKGVGEGAVASILAARAAEGPFRSLTDFCSRVDLRLNNRKVIETLVKSGSFDSLGRSRAALMAGLESAVDVAAAHREAAASSQNVLFDEPPETRHDDRFPDLPEWHADEKIRYEKETLGFYITGHPLARFEEEIALFGDLTAETAREKIDQQVRIVGLVAALKKNQIRKGQNEGKTMAKLVLEDLTGSVSVTVFASLLEKAASWLAPGRAVRVTGTIRPSFTPGAAAPDEGEGGGPIELIAREIEPLEGLREESAREVVLVAAIPETLDETFAGVRELLEASPGEIPVSFELRRAGHFEARVRLGPRFAVKPTPLLTERLENLLGPKAVRYRYAAS
ncbi:MAG TPA: DNA polymerase III subunit alpha [Thermoanaerobaculia bacterium]|nr:DNA polymerase III subunit alpha [Thermoanaerobaculia bacterium]